MTALPCPMSAASSSNCPWAGRGACHSNTGNSNGRPSARACQGSRIASSTPPITPAAPAQTRAQAWRSWRMAVRRASPGTGPAPAPPRPPRPTAARADTGHRQRRDHQRHPGNGHGVGQQPDQRHLPEQQQRERRQGHGDHPLLAQGGAHLRGHAFQALIRRHRMRPERRPHPWRTARPPRRSSTRTRPATAPRDRAPPPPRRRATDLLAQGQRRADSRNRPTPASIQMVRWDGTPQPLKSA